LPDNYNGSRRDKTCMCLPVSPGKWPSDKNGSAGAKANGALSIT
jgi:hypothetical protein